MLSNRLAFALLALATLPMQSALAEQPVEQTANKVGKLSALTVPADAPAQAETELELGPGDKVQITAYERDDISGTFTVRTDGAISIPLIGKIEARGKTLSELEEATAAAIEAATSRSVPISLEVTAWRSIYAVGDVESPGVYAFTPGMTVLHALAAAGGFQRQLNNASPFEINRESTNLHRAIDELKTATAKRARIQAELDGKDTIKVPAALLKLAGPREARRLIEAELSVLRQNTKSQRLQRATKIAEIKLMKQEIEAYKKQRVDIQKRVALNLEELKKYTKLQAKGLARSSRTLQLRSEIAALDANSHTVLASIARSENSLIRINEEMDLLPINKRLELDRELQEVTASIRQSETVLRLHGELVNRLSLLTTKEAEAIAKPARYEIMRSVANRQTLLPAEETTSLRPGDVVRVLKPAADVPSQFGGPSGSSVALSPAPAIK